MNWVDILVLVVLSVCSYHSLRMGFLRQTFTVLGFVVGVYAALTHHQSLAAFLAPAIPHVTLARAVAFVLVLVVVWIACSALASMARQALNAAGLAWADSLFGMLLGLGVGLFIVVSLLVLLVRVPFLGIGATVEQSALATVIFRLLPHLGHLLPRGARILRLL